MFITRVYNKVDNRLTHYAYKLNADGTYDAEPVILDEIEGKPGEEIKVQHSFALTSDRKLMYMLRTLPNERGKFALFVPYVGQRIPRYCQPHHSYPYRWQAQKWA